MHADKLIQSKFAKENIRAYLCYWKAYFIDGVIGIVLWAVFFVALYFYFNNFFVELNNESFKLVLFFVVGFLLLFLYVCFISIFAIKIKRDIKYKDVIFQKIIIDKIDIKTNIFKEPLWYKFDKLYPEKLHVEKTIIYYFDSYGNTKKLHMIASGKKGMEIFKRFEEKKKEMPVYYLRTSGLVVAIMDENASSQDKMYYKSLNSMI